MQKNYNKQENDLLEDEIGQKDVDSVYSNMNSKEQFQPDNLTNKNFPPLEEAGLNKGQKFAVAGLAFFAVLVIVMWMVQFKKNLTAPFNYSGNTENNQTETCTGPDCGSDSEEAMRNKDTDGDGLSDWDELNIYLTSPYLEDSDSDGFSDKNEIDSENDPNCPTGRDCYGTSLNSDSEPQKSGGDSQESNSNLQELNDLLKQSANQNVSGSDTQTQSNTQEEAVNNILEGKGNAQILRAILLESGMDENILNQISDEDLMKSYEEVLSGGE